MIANDVGRALVREVFAAFLRLGCTSFGGPIAHGYLTLSLAPILLNKVLDIPGMTYGINYGANKVRFPSPVPVGAQLRMGVTVASAEGSWLTWARIRPTWRPSFWSRSHATSIQRSGESE